MRVRETGFTLIELMIVIVVVAVLAAVAASLFLGAVKTAKNTEALVQLDKIGKRALIEYSAHATFPALAAPTTPAVSCCTQNAGGKRKCAVVAADWDTPEWRALGFSMDKDFFYQYAYTPAGGGTSFVATATGDRDCDSTTVAFTLTGDIVGDGPRTTLTEPPESAD